MSEPAPHKPAAPRPPVGRIFRLALPEWRLLTLGTLLLFAGQSALLYFSLALKDLVDAMSAGDMSLVNRTALTVVAVMTSGGIASGLRSYCFITSGEHAVARLREALYRAILSQEVAFFDERRTGELMSRLSSDCAVLQSAMSTNISTLLRHVTIVVGGVGVMFYRSPQLSLLMLGLVPFTALGSRLYAKRARKLARDVQDALARAGELTEESISGLRTVRSFAAEEREAQRYGREIQRAFELARRRGRMAATFTGFTEITGMLVVIAMLWYGAKLSVDSLGRGMTAGALFSFIAVTLQVATSLGMVSELWSDLLRATGAAERIFELLDRVPAISLSGGRRLEQVQGEVRFESVRFAYPTRRDAPVLKGLSLELDAGEIVALVGHSGAGKSTVSSLLARLYEPDGGRILIDGQDLRELDPSWLRQQIGIVSQEPILFSCSIAENIRYGRPEATAAEVEAAARVANAYDFISRFPQGFDTLVGERGVQLSGGQKQRVAIARAVLKNPRILILDEATSALDAESEHLVKEAMDRLMKGRTTLIIAHRLSTVMGANRVLVLDSGTVVQSGNHQTLMDEDGPYRRLVQLQLAAA